VLREYNKLILVVIAMSMLLAVTFLYDSTSSNLEYENAFEESATLPSVEWYTTFGYENQDSLNAVVETNDQNYVAAGWTSTDTGNKDIMLVKADFEGNELWRRSYGGSQNEAVWSIKETRDNGFIMSGWNGSTTYDLLIIRTDSEGEILWSTTWGGDWNEGGSEVIETIDGSFVVAGWTWSYSSGDSDYLVAKFDSNGNYVWHRNFGGYLAEEASGIVETYDGNYVIVGYSMTYGMADERDIWMIKINPLGGMYWSKTFGGIDGEYSHQIIETRDRGLLIAGTTESFGAGSWDAWLIKTDRNGNEQWSQTYGGIYSDTAMGVVETYDGGYTIVGTTESDGSGGIDAWFVKTTLDGLMEWPLTYGGSNDDTGYSIFQTSDDGFIAAGYTSSFGAGDIDGWLIKLPFNPVKVLDTPEGINIGLNEPELRVRFLFDNVTNEDKTFLARKPVGPLIPSGEIRVSSYYDITTDAEFEDSVRIWITYRYDEVTNPDALKVIKYDFRDKLWKDVTKQIQQEENYVIAEISSFSIFTIVQPSDVNPPTTLASLEGILGNSDWYISEVNVSLSATDDVSISNTFYSDDGMNWLDYSGKFTISDEGTHSIYYYSMDSLGNTESTKSITLKIDLSPPVTELRIDGSVENESITYVMASSVFHLNASDEISGLAQTFYRINGSEWIDLGDIGYYNFTLVSSGIQIIDYYSIDQAGNMEDIQSLRVTVTNPSINAFISRVVPSPPFTPNAIDEFNVYFVKVGDRGYKLVTWWKWFWYNIELKNNLPIQLSETIFTPDIPTDFEIRAVVVWIEGKCFELPTYIFVKQPSIEWFYNWTSSILVSYDGQNITVNNLDPGKSVFVTILMEYIPHGNYYDSVEDFSLDPYHFSVKVSTVAIISDSQEILSGEYVVSTELAPIIAGVYEWRFCKHTWKLGSKSENTDDVSGRYF